VEVDTGAIGTPVALRTAAATNGDAVVVWLANDGTRNNLWANRFIAASGSWGTALNIETSSTNVDEFDVTADGSGNLIVVWKESAQVRNTGPVFTTRFDVSAASWSVPFRLTDVGIYPRVASDASGNVLAVWSADPFVHARFYDAAACLWLPETPGIEQNLTGTGASDIPLAAFDAQGNALAVWRNGRASAQLIASNNYRGSTRQWNTLAPGDPGPIGVVPGSLQIGGIVSRLQLTALPAGDFQLVWQTQTYLPANHEIRAARFAAATQGWSNGLTIVPPNTADDVTLQRLAADSAGNTIVLWTQTQGTRTALFAVHARAGTASWDSGRVIDSAVGGGAAGADVAFTTSGTALAVWQQFEGGRPDDGTRSNVTANRYDAASDSWTNAIVAESQPGNALSPRISAARGTVIAWIQRDGTADRIKALRP
jgi:hypothetical protein